MEYCGALGSTDKWGRLEEGQQCIGYHYRCWPTYHKRDEALDEVGRDLHRKAILAGDWFLDEPGGAIVCFALEAVLEKGAEVLLGEDLTAPLDMFVVHQGFISVVVVELNEITGEGWASQGTTRIAKGLKLDLFSHGAGELLAVCEGDVDVLAGEVVSFELLKDIRGELVDSGYGGELDLAKDWITQGIGEYLVDVASASVLQKE